MKTELLAPCAMYCGACAIYMASREDNEKLKGKLATAYGVDVAQIACNGCLSDERFVYCETCGIRSCVMEKNLDGCHQCEAFPCRLIDHFPVPVGKKVILRSVPDRRRLGTEEWVKQEQERYCCPHCDSRLFRGARRCASCKEPVDPDETKVVPHQLRPQREQPMKINPDVVAPCGLYCGVCAVYIAHRDRNRKFKERLLGLYQGKVAGKGTLPNSKTLSIEDIRCKGCLSEEPFMHCRQCAIRDCTREKGFAGCHQCDAFPCRHIDDFPMTVGKKVILRAVPYWRKVGTEKWIADEEARYICPECGNRVFRGVVRCNRCKAEMDLD